MICTAYYDSPIGRLLLAERDGGLIGLWLKGQRYAFAVPAEEIRQMQTPLLLQTAQWLDRYFAGQRPDPAELPLRPIGTPFRQAVWALLLQIPYGRTTTYGAIAQELTRTGGRRTSARAVGGAVGHNPISILIPCHRVVGADGSLTGYAGGLAAKTALLQHEKGSR